MFVPDLTPTFYGAVSTGLPGASRRAPSLCKYSRGSEVPKIWVFCVQTSASEDAGAAASVTTSVVSWWGRFGLWLMGKSWNPAELVPAELRGGRRGAG